MPISLTFPRINSTHPSVNLSVDEDDKEVDDGIYMQNLRSCGR
jgi:hypothetical protein